MRTEENCVILEGGDNLFRYNLGRELPTEWSIDYSNPEYTIIKSIFIYFFYCIRYINNFLSCGRIID